MSSESVYMNYASTMGKASQLEELAARLYKAADKLEEETCACAGRVWSGSAGEEYKKKSHRVAERMRRRAKQLERSASVLKYAAAEHHRAEMLALRIIGG